MTKKIIVSSISCIDVEIFSSVENYIAYVGYPWQDWIDDENVYEEDGRLLKFYIENRYNLIFDRSEIMIDNFNRSMKKYIKVFNLELKLNPSTQDMIDCIVKFRGITI